MLASETQLGGDFQKVTRSNSFQDLRLTTPICVPHCFAVPHHCPRVHNLFPFQYPNPAKRGHGLQSKMSDHITINVALGVKNC